MESLPWQRVAQMQTMVSAMRVQLLSLWSEVVRLPEVVVLEIMASAY